MKIIREVRNVLDGRYTVREDDEKRKTPVAVAGGFRETESRVVKKLMDLGLAIPSKEKKSESQP